MCSIRAVQMVAIECAFGGRFCACVRIEVYVATRTTRDVSPYTSWSSSYSYYCCLFEQSLVLGAENPSHIIHTHTVHRSDDHRVLRRIILYMSRIDMPDRNHRTQPTNIHDAHFPNHTFLRRTFRPFAHIGTAPFFKQSAHRVGVLMRAFASFVVWKSHIWDKDCVVRLTKRMCTRLFRLFSAYYIYSMYIYIWDSDDDEEDDVQNKSASAQGVWCARGKFFAQYGAAIKTGRPPWKTIAFVCLHIYT